MNSSLSKWIKIFHSLTFNIESEFADIYSYENRLKHFKNVFQRKVLRYRNAFLVAYKEDAALRNAYHEYMNKDFDYILFVNLNISAPDQRKFDGGGYIPFTAYWYQVIIWELYNHFTLAYYKSRDIGLSFAINAGETMSLVHNRGDEIFYLSRVQDDVDKSRDRSNSNMGRVRQLVESTKIYTLDHFYHDVFLTLYSDKKTGITGSSTNGNPNRGKRGKRTFVDEAGAQKNLNQVVQSISMSSKFVAYAGTLLIGTDAAFREIIKEGFEVNPLELFNEIKDNMSKGKTYRESVDAMVANLRGQIPEGKAISFHNTYRDHPLKAGKCDYYDIECNRLLNDEVIIAHELEADLNAGSPDRSFYSLTSDHFDKIDAGDLKQYEIIMGFDPGSHGTAAMCPIIVDHMGFYYVLEVEQFHKGSMLEWIDKLKNKYGNFTVFAESSVKAYSKAGAGWMSALRKADIKTIIVSNRDMDDQLLVVNELLRRKILDEDGEEHYKVIMDEGNKWFGMSYIYGEKYNDIRQRAMSHSAEAMIAPLFHLNKDIIENVRRGVDYG